MTNLSHPKSNANITKAKGGDYKPIADILKHKQPQIAFVLVDMDSNGRLTFHRLESPVVLRANLRSKNSPTEFELARQFHARFDAGRNKLKKYASEEKYVWMVGSRIPTNNATSNSPHVIYILHQRLTVVNVLKSLPLLESIPGEVHLYKINLNFQKVDRFATIPADVLLDMIGIQKWNNTHAVRGDFRSGMQAFYTTYKKWPVEKKKTERTGKRKELSQQNNGNNKTKRSNQPPSKHQKTMMGKIYHFKIDPSQYEEILMIPQSSSIRLRRYEDVKYRYRNLENTAEYIYRLSNKTKQNWVNQMEIDTTILIPRWMKVIVYKSITEGTLPPPPKGKVLLNKIYIVVSSKGKTYEWYPHGIPLRTNSQIAENNKKGIKKFTFASAEEIEF